MKRMVYLLCTFVLLFSFAGCNSASGVNSSTENSVSSEQEIVDPGPPGPDLISVSSYEDIIKVKRASVDSYTAIDALELNNSNRRSMLYKSAEFFSRGLQWFAAPNFSESTGIFLDEITMYFGYYDGDSYSDCRIMTEFHCAQGNIEIWCWSYIEGETVKIGGKDVDLSGFKGTTIIDGYTVGVVNGMSMLGVKDNKYAVLINVTAKEDLRDKIIESIQLPTLGEYLYSVEKSRMNFFESIDYLSMLMSVYNDSDWFENNVKDIEFLWFKNEQDVTQWLDRWKDAIILLPEKRVGYGLGVGNFAFFEDVNTDVLTFETKNTRFITYKGNAPQYKDAKVIEAFEKDGFTCTVYDTEFRDFVMVNGDRVIKGHSKSRRSDALKLVKEIESLEIFNFSEFLDKNL